MKNKNLNEQINRIKSLFTEERLYGNLCEQDFDFNWGSNASPSGKPSMVSGDKTVQVGLHDSLCNDKHKEYCEKENLIATNVTQLGKDWDIEEGSVTVFNNNYYTLGKGHWDYKEYTKCACRRGKVENGEFIEDKTPIITAITDPQFEKLLRGEITNDEYNNYLAKMKSIENKEFRSLDRFSYSMDEFWNYHLVFDILAIAAGTLIGGWVGLGLAAFIEALNAIGYFKEDEKFMGTISIVLGVFAPAVIESYRVIKSAGLSKNLDEFLDWILKNEKATADDVYLKGKEIFGEKNLKKHGKDIDDFLSELVKNKSSIIAGTKLMGEVLTNTEFFMKIFKRNPEIMKKYLDINGGDLFMAYMGYLKTLRLKEFKTAIILYFSLPPILNKTLNYIYSEFISTEQEIIEQSGLTPKTPYDNIDNLTEEEIIEIIGDQYELLEKKDKN